MITENKHKDANRLFAKSLLLVCVFLMLLSAIARLFGVLWFAIDESLFPTPSENIQVIVFTALKLFELVFTHKVLCRLKWKWCILIATIQVIITGFLDGNVQNIIDLLFIIILPVFFNLKEWKHSLLDNIFFYLLVFAYSATFLFGRVGLVYDAKTSFMLAVLGIIDYKILFVAIYLVVKINGGIKLWKKQKRPLLMKKDLL